MTRLIWDIFLRYHGIGRGGPVHIAVMEPGAGEWRTDFHVAVAFGIRRTNGDLSPDSWPGVREGESARYTERALAWTLEALWTYPQDLGLVEEKPRKGDKTK